MRPALRFLAFAVAALVLVALFSLVVRL